MNNAPRKHMDITGPNRPTQRTTGGMRLARRQKMVGGIVFLLTLVLLAGIQWFQQRNTLGIDSSRYQVVFLDNDQVFFGRLQNTHGDYLTLKDAYYVQNQDSTTEQPAEQQENTQLLKVRDTVYGPDDTMSIQSSKVLFWQNLRDDSKVSQAIKSK